MAQRLNDLLLNAVCENSHLKERVLFDALCDAIRDHCTSEHAVEDAVHGFLAANEFVMAGDVQRLIAQETYAHRPSPFQVASDKVRDRAKKLLKETKA